MMKTCMNRSWVHIIGKSKLFYSPKPLKPGMLNQFKDQGTLNTYKAMDRVVKYLESIQIIQFSNNKGIVFSMYI